MKPVVGVMPLWDEDKDSIWMLPGYIEGIRAAGGTAVTFPFTDDEEEISRLMELCDGFLFTGGQDVSPEIYGEKPLDGLKDFCSRKDVMERIVLSKAIAQDKPVLGICRGIQFINAALGGTLYQDIKAQYGTKTEHHMEPPYDVPVHSVYILPDSPLGTLFGTATAQVNSYHHQAVKKLAPSLKAMAYSSDGLVEAAFRPESRFLWAVQWHPEFMYRSDKNSMAIFRAFVDSLKN